MCACVRACVHACVCVCFVVIVHWHCSAQLSMFNMEKRYRNKIIIIIIIMGKFPLVVRLLYTTPYIVALQIAFSVFVSHCVFLYLFLSPSPCSSILYPDLSVSAIMHNIL